ncbi:N-acetylglucosamine-6-phosphate deacetylase [Pilibacter termitis]|jgi:N-acetylglucosamine-6-phosphate deacetylase|uniref:N-acetylglucosamine-6-phosphate deacetylase n=1 Tax=Pilibacter termitis TaxID=263852 RepID=A0A1T4KUP1_9ENTE|nr:N-acetylglucosamine-6-phosphate deacetylase [Pilibacter termitis]SJZ46017.1 N-acetylglucosamine-6-phosphate deacetylase [Pilibacter termitis]
MKKYILADKFFYPNRTRGKGYLEIVDGKFGRYFETLPEENAEVVDYSGKWIAPGLVDTHIHGMLGVDVMDNKPEDVTTIMSEGLLKCGVTSFLPTTLTGDYDLLEEVARGIAENKELATGAKIQGIYFEGPHFTEEHKGAQNPKYFENPSIEQFKKWQKAAGGCIKKIAIAPEREGAREYVRMLSEQGVVVALGHSNATYEQAADCVDAGASVWVHTFNGMRGMTHREAGMVGAAMTLKHTFAELICDGHHVEPVACEVLMDKIGRDHIALITDCMRAGAMPDGEYILGEFPVVVAQGMARLKEGASLAGSVLELKDALKNVVAWNLATPEEAVEMASLIPAVSCKIDDKCGKIMAGRDADFIVLDHEMNLCETYLNGISRYKA